MLAKFKYTQIFNAVVLGKMYVTLIWSHIAISLKWRSKDISWPLPSDLQNDVR